ncbi:hypothetical protein NLI96_g10928 [Meripilus lineatus]|uniref:Extracellular membrane protein CFEM domain-containing protein n=1 Tax=Meripilus lineatus TaxID=2056292 RepID=A0AAD5UX27_9APHY|nr:hypothetical protein NLI96_g10928 [Physisporinus lineatus]
MLTFPLLSALVFATQASAFTNLGDARSSLSDFLHGGSVFARQLNPGDIPSACRSDCAYTVAILNDETCVATDCFCTEVNNREFAKCFKCLDAGNEAALEESQATLSGYEDTCRDGGAPLASLTIVDSSPSSTRPPTTRTPISSPGLTTPSAPPIIVTPSSMPQTIVTPTTLRGAGRSTVTPSSSGVPIQSSGVSVPNGGRVSSTNLPLVVSIFILLVGTTMFAV